MTRTGVLVSKQEAASSVYSKREFRHFLGNDRQ